MSHDIFRLDWILIDTIIIILLLLLLTSVKVFKEISRWRFSLSNESLKLTTLKDLKFNTTQTNVIVKHCSVIKENKVASEDSSKVVVILSTGSFKRKLLRLLSEGLGSFGFDIVSIGLKIKPGIDNNSTEQIKQGPVRSIIAKILELLEQDKLISSSKYFVIQYSDSLLRYKSILTDVNNTGIISINPKVNKLSLSMLSNLVDRENTFHLIFSKKSYLILNNSSLKKFLKENPHYNKLGIQLTIIEKSRKSFKYYETILLGTILNIIEIKK